MEPYIQGGGLHVVRYNALPAAAKIDAWKLYKASLPATKSSLKEKFDLVNDKVSRKKKRRDSM